MTVRTAYVGTEVSGDVLTAANFDKLPGGWIGHAAVTADQGSITVEADLTSLTVTVTVNASRRIRVSACVRMSNSAANGGTVCLIYEGSTLLDKSDGYPGIADARVKHTPSAILTPSTGSHTYKLRGDIAATGTATVRADATFPAYILVEDLGPAS